VYCNYIFLAKKYNLLIDFQSVYNFFKLQTYFYGTFIVKDRKYTSAM